MTTADTHIEYAVLDEDNHTVEITDNRADARNYKRLYQEAQPDINFRIERTTTHVITTQETIY